MNAACQKGRKKLYISGQLDPVAVSSVLKARERGWVEPLACGSAFTGMASEIKVLCPSADIREARQEALSLAQAEEPGFLLDTGPLDAGFFSLIADKKTDYNHGHMLSYVSIMIAPKDGQLTLLTDTLINNQPGFREKIAIVENAIRVAKALGIQRPKIAALSALELVNPALPSTLDAALLSKMSERGQFGDAVIEGPLAMDNAESTSAARHKGINSPVPGDVDIYLFPDLESANLTVQFLGWVGRCPIAGVLAGAKVPLVVRSILEPPESWLVNLALGCLL
ncbi:phosphate acyltransferase [Desulfosarcina widdelii]|nr:phosphate acyltransferase [Desulfosarcina widdelii]